MGLCGENSSPHRLNKQPQRSAEADLRECPVHIHHCECTHSTAALCRAVAQLHSSQHLAGEHRGDAQGGHNCLTPISDCLLSADYKAAMRGNSSPFVLLLSFFTCHRTYRSQVLYCWAPAWHEGSAAWDAGQSCCSLAALPPVGVESSSRSLPT